METVKKKKRISQKSTVLNPAQLHFLQMLAFIKTDVELKKLKRLVRDFCAQQLQQEADKYWEEGKISEQLLSEHLRTPYK